MSVKSKIEFNVIDESQEKKLLTLGYKRCNFYPACSNMFLPIVRWQIICGCEFCKKKLNLSLGKTWRKSHPNYHQVYQKKYRDNFNTKIKLKDKERGFNER